MNTLEYLHISGVLFQLLKQDDLADLKSTLENQDTCMIHVELLQADHGYRFFIVVVPAGSHVDINKASLLLGGAELAKCGEKERALYGDANAERLLSPFGAQYGLVTLVDETICEAQKIVIQVRTDQWLLIRTADFLNMEHPLTGKLTLEQETASIACGQLL